MANIKRIPYSTQCIEKDDIDAVVSVLRSDWLTQGPKVNEFERKLADYCGAKYAVAVANGTAALHIACLACGVQPGDEVITSPLTFLASANCVLYCQGRPVFADVQSDTANIDPREIENKVNKKTKAIIPVHFAGLPCDLLRIEKIAKANKLTVIEDAAHAFGASYRGSKIGACKYSDMTIFSFHPVKTITTGEGGAVLTNKKDLYDKLLMLRNHGVTKDSSKWIGLGGARNNIARQSWYYQMQVLGFNFRITDMQAALGISQLKKADRFIARRKEIVNQYGQAFEDNAYFDIPAEKDNRESSWHLYAIRLKDEYMDKKIEIVDGLKDYGLAVQVHYIPVYLQPYYKNLGFKAGICPKAEELYEKEISIPLYQSMDRKDVAYVIESIFKVFEKIKLIK